MWENAESDPFEESPSPTYSGMLMDSQMNLHGKSGALAKQLDLVLFNFRMLFALFGGCVGIMLVTFVEYARSQKTIRDRTSTNTVSSVAPPTGTMSAEEQALVDLVNQERMRAGLRPLSVDARLIRAAQIHSADMARFKRLEQYLFGAALPSLSSRIHFVGYDASCYAENIACGHVDAAAAMKAFMKSPGHKANILDPALTHIGVGIAYGAPPNPWYTQEFGGQASASTAVPAPTGASPLVVPAGPRPAEPGSNTPPFTSLPTERGTFPVMDPAPAQASTPSPNGPPPSTGPETGTLRLPIGPATGTLPPYWVKPTVTPPPAGGP